MKFFGLDTNGFWVKVKKPALYHARFRVKGLRVEG
jgi:hypothetical protein